MQSHEIPAASSAITTLYRIFDKPAPDDETLKAWIKVLRELPLRAVQSACEAWQANEDKLPRPSQIAAAARKGAGIAPGSKQQCGYIHGGKRCPLVAVVLGAGLCSGHWQLDRDPEGSQAYLAHLERRPKLFDGDWRHFKTSRDA